MSGVHRTAVGIAAAVLLAIGGAAAPANAASISDSNGALPVGASYAQFSSPSHNIGCWLDGDGVRCDVSGHTYKTPKRPKSCDLDYGDSVELGAKGKGFFGCHGDTVLGSNSVLKYNHSRTIGHFRCTSRKSGMTCVNTKTKHGFTLSRGAYRLW